MSGTRLKMTNLYDLHSYKENSLCIICLSTGKEAFLQGEDAAALRDELDKIGKLPVHHQARAMNNLFDCYM